MKKLTHIGVCRGVDSRTPDIAFKICLRETKLYWVSKNGTKFKKKNGNAVGDWPMYGLYLNSIKPL